MDMMVDGRKATAKETFDVLNPATLEIVDTAPRSGPEDLERAVAAAKAAQAAWCREDIATRRRAIEKAATLVRENLPEIARLLTLEQGKPLGEAMVEVGIAAAFFESFASSLSFETSCG